MPLLIMVNVAKAFLPLFFCRYLDRIQSEAHQNEPCVTGRFLNLAHLGFCTQFFYAFSLFERKHIRIGVISIECSHALGSELYTCHCL